MCSSKLYSLIKHIYRVTHQFLSPLGLKLFPLSEISPLAVQSYSSLAVCVSSPESSSQSACILPTNLRKQKHALLNQGDKDTGKDEAPTLPHLEVSA